MPRSNLCNVQQGKFSSSGKVTSFPPSSQRANKAAAAAPRTCPPTKSGTLLGETPAKGSVIARAKVTAGLATEDDDVSQQAVGTNATTATAIDSTPHRKRSGMNSTSTHA